MLHTYSVFASVKKVRGGTVIAKGSGTEMTTTTHQVQTKHGSRTETRHHYRAKYEWTNPVTGNPMKVEFSSDDSPSRGKAGLPQCSRGDAEQWYHHNNPSNGQDFLEVYLAVDDQGEAEFILNVKGEKPYSRIAVKPAILFTPCLIMPILQVIKLSVTFELEGGERANVRDYFFFFIDKTQLPDGFRDSPSFDGSHFAAFQTNLGLHIAIGIAVLVALELVALKLFGYNAMRAVKKLQPLQATSTHEESPSGRKDPAAEVHAEAPDKGALSPSPDANTGTRHSPRDDGHDEDEHATNPGIPMQGVTHG